MMILLIFCNAGSLGATAEKERIGTFPGQRKKSPTSLVASIITKREISKKEEVADESLEIKKQLLALHQQLQGTINNLHNLDAIDQVPIESLAQTLGGKYPFLIDIYKIIPILVQLAQSVRIHYKEEPYYYESTKPILARSPIKNYAEQIPVIYALLSQIKSKQHPPSILDPSINDVTSDIQKIVQSIRRAIEQEIIFKEAGNDLQDISEELLILKKIATEAPNLLEADTALTAIKKEVAIIEGIIHSAEQATQKLNKTKEKLSKLELPTTSEPIKEIFKIIVSAVSFIQKTLKDYIKQVEKGNQKLLSASYAIHRNREMNHITEKLVESRLQDLLVKIISSLPIEAMQPEAKTKQEITTSLQDIADTIRSLNVGNKPIDVEGYRGEIKKVIDITNSKLKYFSALFGGDLKIPKEISDILTFALTTLQKNYASFFDLQNAMRIYGSEIKQKKQNLEATTNSDSKNVLLEILDNLSKQVENLKIVF
jgi:hypothetical protein